MQIALRLLPQTRQRLYRNATPLSRLQAAYNTTSAPLVRIEDATFYRSQPSRSPSEDEILNNPPLFSNLQFELTANDTKEEHWAIIGRSNAGKTTLLEILRGQHLCFPPNGRKFPYLSTLEKGDGDLRLRHPSNAIQYVGFGGTKDKGLSGIGTYISARYESRKEATDFSLLDFLKGNVHLNALESVYTSEQERLLERVVQDLDLEKLLNMPVNNLSNGQSRRARIAKALLGRPELLLLDEPFMGLDPVTTLKLSPLLHKLAQSRSPRLLLTLRPQDPVPEWISHVAVLGRNLNVTHQGTRLDVATALSADGSALQAEEDHVENRLSKLYLDIAKTLSNRTDEKDAQTIVRSKGSRNPKPGDTVIASEGVQVKYGDKIILGDWRQSNINSGRLKKPGLHWTVKKGQRWGLFGANGSGKTTLLSMITSDHPQAYSNPLKVFGRHRLPSAGTPGISLFELQSRIGQSSPEVHAFFPRNLTIRQCLETAYSDTPMSKPLLTSKDDIRIEACLRWFQAELNPKLGPNAFSDYATDDSDAGNAIQELNRYPGITPQGYSIPRDQQLYEHSLAQAASVEWADKLLFGETSISAQKVTLFLRAIVKSPEIIILDEAFSGLDDMTRDKCLLFLEEGETAKIADPNLPLTRTNTKETGELRTIAFRQLIYDSDGYVEGLTKDQALIVVSHIKEELPMCITDWIYLPEAGEGKVCRIGVADGRPIRDSASKWNEVWGI